MTNEATKQAARDDAAVIFSNLAVNDDAIVNIEFLTALAGEIDDLIAGQVAVARTTGDTWQDVANALGVTKQGAQQKYR